MTRFESFKLIYLINGIIRCSIYTTGVQFDIDFSTKLFHKKMVKRITAEMVLTNFPEPTDTQLIARVTECLGQNQFKVKGKNNEYLVSLPPKFQKTVWIKNHSFVIIEPFTNPNKVEGEIIYILFKDDIKNLKQKGIWPFELELFLEDSEEVDGLFVNRNRHVASESDCESI
jgi:probable RNA-binding protein EIF1AD